MTKQLPTSEQVAEYCKRLAAQIGFDTPEFFAAPIEWQVMGLAILAKIGEDQKVVDDLKTALIAIS